MERAVETCSFHFKHILESFNAEAPFSPFLLYLAPLTLSKTQGQ